MTSLGWVDRGAKRWRLLAIISVAALSVLALTGPATERRDSLSFRNLDGVVVILDVSPSMTESPAWPQMMTMARVIAATLDSRPGGLIVYAGDAYVAMEMTMDHLQLGQTISLIDAQTVPDPGSRPARAIALASDMIRNAGVIAGDVLIITDGAGIGPAAYASAEKLLAQGARLSVVSQNAAASELAIIGDGQVFAPDQTAALTAWMRDNARTRLERQDYPLLFWNDYGRFLLVLALFPMLHLFRRQLA